MAVKKTKTEKELTKTEKELTKALTDNQILKQEIESLKKLLETFQENKNEMALKYEKRAREQKDIIATLRTDLSHANTHVTNMGERLYNSQNEARGFKEFSAELENDVRLMSKAIVKIMMGVERDD